MNINNNKIDNLNKTIVPQQYYEVLDIIILIKTRNLFLSFKNIINS